MTESVRQRLVQRYGRSVLQLIRFGVVGTSGVLVNMVVLILAKRILPDAETIFFDIPITRFNVRWYHVLSTIAFLVANLWNFQLNRWWTFGSAKHAKWWREYLPFLVVGFLGQLIGLGLLTLLMHPGSFLSLPTDVLDDSSGFRTRLYWAQLIVILVVLPISFLLNKVWTFKAVRRLHSPRG